MKINTLTGSNRMEEKQEKSSPRGQSLPNL